MADAAFEREIDPQQQVRQFLGVIRRGWLPIVTCVGAGLLIGIALWFFIPKHYMSTAKLVMRSNWMFESPGSIRAVDDLPFAARARQLEDLLRSTAWIEAVLDKLEWQEWAKAKGRGDLEQRAFMVKVKEGITSRVVASETGESVVFVSFTWTDRQMAAQFCRALVDHWLRYSVDEYVSDLDRRVALFEESLRSRQSEVDDACTALEEFETRHGISAINQRQNAQARHDQTQLQLDALNSDIAALHAMIEVVDQELAVTDAAGRPLVPPTLPESSEVPNDQKLALLEQLAIVNDEVQRLRSEGFTETWPPLKQAYEELARLVKEVSELPNTVTIRNEPLPNPEYVTKKSQRDDLWVELQGYNAQKMQMETKLGEMAEDLQTLPEVLRQHESLRASVTTKRFLLTEQETALAPLKDRKLAVSRKGVGQLVPFQTLEQPVPATSPSSAIGVLALTVSTLLGLGIALAVVVGKELLRSSFGSAEQARRALKLPVLGEVAPIQTAVEVRRARFVRTLQIAASIVLLTGIGAAIWVCVAHPKDLPRGLVEWALDLRASLS